MRFQSNGAFSRLAPDLVTDAFAGSTGQQVIVPSGGAVVLLASAPGAGNYLQVFALSIEAPLGTASSGTLRIQDTNGNFIMGGYQTQSAGGIWFYWSGYLPLSVGLQAVNSTTVNAIATAFFRSVPIPA